MNNSELIWRLIEMLLQKRDNQETDCTCNDEKLNDKKPDEV